MSESLEESYSSPTRLLKKITKCCYNTLMDNPSEMGIKPMGDRWVWRRCLVKLKGAVSAPRR